MVLSRLIAVMGPDVLHEELTFDQYLEIAQQRDPPLIDKDYFSKDGWERPFRWEINKIGLDWKITIISSGRNGQFESGGGDDYWLEVRLNSKNGAIETKKNF